MQEPPSTAGPAKPAPDAVRRVRNLHILPRVLAGVIRNSLRDPRAMRHHLLKNLWIELKRFGAPNLQSIEPGDLFCGSPPPLVVGSPVRQDPLLAVALSKALGCKTIFEIGTFLGDTTWLFAHNNPRAHVYTLDLPGLEWLDRVRFDLTDPEYFLRWDRGQRFAGTPEAARITQLSGDSATFDFSPYQSRIDLVYVDGSHSYSYVKSDSEAALAMLSPGGAIVWDDYTYYPGIYRYLNELSPKLPGGIQHIRGSRLAIHSRRDLGRGMGAPRLEAYSRSGRSSS